MKKIFTLFIAMFTGCSVFAQTTAQDWTKTDCVANNSHHLFSMLDSGYCVIMDLVMIPSCQSCIDATAAIEPIIQRYNAQYPGKVRLFTMGYNNAYNCQEMKAWVSNNSFAPFAAFAQNLSETQYYGGMGMPTIVVAGKSNHAVVYNKQGFVPSDTTAIKTAIDDVLAAASGIREMNENGRLIIYPNPVNENGTINIELKEPAKLKISILDILGETVADIFSGNKNSGFHIFEINSKKLPAGVYFVKMKMNEKTVNQRLLISH